MFIGSSTYPWAKKSHKAPSKGKRTRMSVRTSRLVKEVCAHIFHRRGRKTSHGDSRSTQKAQNALSLMTDGTSGQPGRSSDGVVEAARPMHGGRERTFLLRSFPFRCLRNILPHPRDSHVHFIHPSVAKTRMCLRPGSCFIVAPGHSRSAASSTSLEHQPRSPAADTGHRNTPRCQATPRDPSGCP